MRTETIHVHATIPASPDAIFDAWLDGDTHALMTGGGATGSARVGERFTAWDGYIEGENLELEPGRRIVQSWRSSEFPDGAGPSKLYVLLDEAPGGTRVTLLHTDIPEGQGADYEQGWFDHYFHPMAKHFKAALPPKRRAPSTGKAAKKSAAKKPAAKKAAAKKPAAKKPAAKKPAKGSARRGR